MITTTRWTPLSEQEQEQGIDVQNTIELSDGSVGLVRSYLDGKAVTVLVQAQFNETGDIDTLTPLAIVATPDLVERLANPMNQRKKG